MNYRTILVHVDQSRPAATRIRLASTLATQTSAHLIGAAMTGISHLVFEGGAFSPTDPTLVHHVTYLRAYASDALTQFTQLAQAAGVNAIEPRLIDDDAVNGLVVQARYADLVVIGQFDPTEAVPGLLPNFPESVLLATPRPVLVVPFAGEATTPPQRVLVAWDASLTATRAVTAALPLLQTAAQVDAVVFNAHQRNEAHGPQPGHDLALYLARHGVKVDVLTRETDSDVGNALLSLAADRGSDLIVMGGYGHARFREILLGGTTRTVLASMTVPVLMAH